MKGFFSKNDVIGQTDNCYKCGLHKTCKSPRMDYTGNGEKGILIIAEAPGKTEDDQNMQLVGQAGGLLRGELLKLGLDLDRDFWKVNAVNCRPTDKQGNNRKPTAVEIRLCRPRVVELINKLKPKFIWLMGGVALESFYMNDFSDTSITRWRKRKIPDVDFKTWVVPLFHPSFVLRNKDNKLSSLFQRDLKWAVGLLADYKPPKFIDFGEYVQPLVNPKEINQVISSFKTGDVVAFDYETSSLNPYKGTPRIWYASMSNGEIVYTFPITTDIVDSFVDFLTHEQIDKIAHNLKFEDKWSRVCFGVKPKGWYWDTMVAQHVLDGRKKTSGLKFQAYVRYGAKRYDAEIAKYKWDWSKIPVDTALKYCGLDSLFTFLMCEDQQNEFGDNKALCEADYLFFQGTLALSDIEHNGINTDGVYYQNESNRLEKEIQKCFESLKGSEESVAFKNATQRDMDFASYKDLCTLFYDIQKIPAIKKTAKNNDTVDETVLSKLNTPFSNKLLEMRKLEKIRNTYLAQFIRETGNDGKLHPSFNLNMVVTYRSSSDKPNFQNIPVRDEKAKRITRSGIIPSKGNQLLEVDYASLEVRIIACVSKDKVLIELLNAGLEPHKDEAKKLFLFDDSEWDKLDPKKAKDIRFYAKNQKVFPYFYGSWFKAVAENVWPLIDQLGIKTHLKRKGISTYDDFLKHCEKDENAFWRKFYGVKQWHNTLETNYIEMGYVEYVTGFRSEGYLSRNDLFNYPIQGPAFHCLLWSLIELNRKLAKYKTKIIGQIHDSIVFDLYPPEKEVVLELCTDVMTKKIKKTWEWLTVPLLVEFEITDIDKSWYTKEGI